MTKEVVTKHNFSVSERKSIRVEGVTQVGAFDEEEIYMVTLGGPLLLKGEGLQISQLNLDDQILTVEGYIKSVQYLDENSPQNFKQKGKNIISRLLR
ncbi:sporulation protein YabP [Heliorestis acidaminivorans]|uniref:Sporulation protein YabP n=1 Tax=Heliorestis acidaminivorans TaxID=553427 RepID=A0A6I0EZX6_9FIRM|nr:sporulation protein YabP [Heliorestis acidaminivorans]KAB2953045.1 sporulation protein YabP [Heliorestis acidaminivorans]